MASVLLCGLGGSGIGSRSLDSCLVAALCFAGEASPHAWPVTVFREIRTAQSLPPPWRLWGTWRTETDGSWAVATSSSRATREMQSAVLRGILRSFFPNLRFVQPLSRLEPAVTLVFGFRPQRSAGTPPATRPSCRLCGPRGD